MNFLLKGFFYRILIDPLLKGLREEVLKQTGKHEKVIDIACGTGTLAIEMAQVTGHVTGIDLDEDLIAYATERTKRERIKNLQFKVHDASNLSSYSKKEFDIAVTSMSVHQFEPQLALNILSEMKRIASKVVIADYNYPMPQGPSSYMAHWIEWMAGGDYHRNFLNYIRQGGINYFTVAAGLTIRSTTVRSNDVFVISVCE